ncbi:MAG: heme-copper oxidase subunit III [Verrucomicrobiota bacterium]
MSHAADASHPADHIPTGLDNKKLMMWLFLASDCMFFGTLITTHLVYRKIYENVGVDPITVFDIELTTASSFILLMSSLLMALAVSAIHKGDVKSFRWNLVGVIIFGTLFLGGQVYEFNHFVHLGLTLSTGTFGSTFYVMTGTHGVHVALGILWLISWLVYSFSPKFNAHENAVDVETAGLYWHFVDIVWIVIFTAVYLIEYV